MGRPGETSTRLRCVHCLSTETPLWRAGPDGPKTLCNACGVRFKKGKLILYRDENGKVTAVKRDDAPPFHVPQVTKKSNKKLSNSSPPQPSSPTIDNSSKRVIKKVPSDPTIAAIPLGKKPRSRSRRITAGQLPGRYITKNFPESISSWRSPSSLSRSPSSSPPESTSLSELDSYFELTQPAPSPSSQQNSLYKFIDVDEENLFADMTSLGIDCSSDSDSKSLLPMPADPSSAEQFSFEFSELGRSTLNLDAPERVEALRSLMFDRTRKVSKTYDAAVQALSRFCNDKKMTADKCKQFVRAFAHDQSVGFCLDDHSELMSLGEQKAQVLLSEKSAYSAAVENFRALMSSTEVAGFAETCMVEMLAEDVVGAINQQQQEQQDQSKMENGLTCRVPDSAVGSKAISTMG